MLFRSTTHSMNDLSVCRERIIAQVGISDISDILNRRKARPLVNARPRITGIKNSRAQKKDREPKPPVPRLDPLWIADRCFDRIVFV